MAKYRKKPIVIEAVQWRGYNLQEVLEMVSASIQVEKGECLIVPLDDTNALEIKTLEGNMRADRDDWIIIGVKGEFYPCKPDIFEATYEPVG